MYVVNQWICQYTCSIYNVVADTCITKHCTSWLCTCIKITNIGNHSVLSKNVFLHICKYSRFVHFIINLAALCVGEVTVVCSYNYTFLNMVIATAIKFYLQIVTLSF